MALVTLSASSPKARLDGLTVTGVVEACSGAFFSRLKAGAVAKTARHMASVLRRQKAILMSNPRRRPVLAGYPRMLS